MKTISIVMPVFNEQENLPRLHERLSAVADKLKDIAFTMVFVDDHSSDRTAEMLRDLAARDPRVRWIRLSRNSGSHIACAAGLDQVTTDAAIMMASDLQDPPEMIPALVDKWIEGFPVVWAVRQARLGESWFTLNSSKLFYWMMNRLCNFNIPAKGADSFLADRVILDALRQIPDRNISLFSTLYWIGFPQAEVLYVKEARYGGKSKVNIRKKLVMALDSFVGFSYVPLRAMSYLGFLFAMVGLCWALVVLIYRIMGYTPIVGYASIMIAILVIGGLQMLMLGVLGEYLWRTLEEARRRPRYFVEASSIKKTS